MRAPRQIIFEFRQVGHYIKVSAVCADTGTEVSIVGDPRASQDELQRIASGKLKRVMEKNDPKPLR